MTTPYISSYDVTTPFSDTCEQFALATGTPLTYTVPGNYKQKYSMEIGLNSTSNVFVGYNVTATVPSAGTKTGTNNLEFRPRKKYVKGGDVISLITPDASAYASISLLQLPN